MENPIKPNTKIKVLSEEHQKVIQEAAKEKGVILNLIYVQDSWISFHYSGGLCAEWNLRDRHPALEEIFIDPPHVGKNENPIKPNTKIRILSPEHSEYVQKLAFEAGFSWQGFEENEMFTSDCYCMFFYPNMEITCSDLGMDFVEKKFKEIFIELPEIEQSVMRLKELADKQEAREQANQRFAEHAESVTPPPNTTAASILEAGLGHMKDRATTYDSPEGERSMGATVEAFEAITGHSLTEEQGWLFMVLLKAVRSQQGNKKLDNYEDGAAYFGLAGEAAMRADK